MAASEMQRNAIKYHTEIETSEIMKIVLKSTYWEEGHGKGVEESVGNCAVVNCMPMMTKCDLFKTKIHQVSKIILSLINL